MLRSDPHRAVKLSGAARSTSLARSAVLVAQSPDLNRPRAVPLRSPPTACGATFWPLSTTTREPGAMSLPTAERIPGIFADTPSARMEQSVGKSCGVVRASRRSSMPRAPTAREDLLLAGASLCLRRQRPHSTAGLPATTLALPTTGSRCSHATRRSSRYRWHFTTTCQSLALPTTSPYCSRHRQRHGRTTSPSLTCCSPRTTRVSSRRRQQRSTIRSPADRRHRSRTSPSPTASHRGWA